MNREAWEKAFEERINIRNEINAFEEIPLEWLPDVKGAWIGGCSYVDQLYSGTIGDLKSTVQMLREGNLEMQKKLDIAIEALEFYGDSAKWEPTDSIIQMPTFMVADDCEKIDCSRAYWGGRMARETLEELKDEK